LSLETSSPSAVAPAGPGRGWIAALVTATVGVAIGWYGPIQILLPAQAELIGGMGKEALLAIVTGTGAAGAMIANPLWGVLSDRLHARERSRMPVLIAGAILGVLGLLVLPFAATPTVMVAGWLVAQTGLNGPFAVLAALIADRVPEERRGLVGSLFGVAQLVGTVVGTVIAVAVGEGTPGYIAVAVAVPLLVTPILFAGRRSASLVRGGSKAGHATWRSLRIDRIYAAAFVLRFLLNLVSALGLLYLYYFLSDRARLCVGAGALAFAEEIPFIVIAVLVLGLGYGLFLAVDVAIVTDALPDPVTRATLLGIANIASSLPQVLAPVIAAPIVTSLGGYTPLYLATGVIALIALVVLPFLRGRVDAALGHAGPR